VLGVCYSIAFSRIKFATSPAMGGGLRAKLWSRFGNSMMDVEQTAGLGFVFGAQARLLAGLAVLDIMDRAACEQGIFIFHVHGSELCTRFVTTR